MTWTAPTDAVMSACGRAAPDRPAAVRGVCPGFVSSKPAPGWLTARSDRLRPALPMPRHQRVRARRPPCPRPPAYPLYLYLLGRPAAALPGFPFDPGRAMLCMLTSPPQWLQWP
jgi:hypothetical protein